MPVLNWPSKNASTPPEAALVETGVVFPHGKGWPGEPAQDRLIHGDNLKVMAALLPELEGKLDLIYADPPFFTNKRYPARIGRGEDSRRPKDWQLADGYYDSWQSLDQYLDMLYPRLVLMHRLLSPAGTLYLHLDWHADAYARLLLDEIFGPDRLLNQIAWVYHGPSPVRSAFNRKHDTILVYTKGDRYTFNTDAIRMPYDPGTVKTFASSKKAGFGKVPDLQRGKVPEDWWYFPVVARLHSERTGYPTQKPAALLERIIRASSNPGDLVADFFCGSGTALSASARLGRRFIGCDLTFRAVHTSYRRLVQSAESAFLLEQEVSLPAQLPVMDEAFARALTRDEAAVHLDESALAGLDFWEVDPSWDGKVFRSAAQAVRTRTNPAPGTIRLPQLSAGEMCVRAVMDTGQTLYARLQK